MAFEITRVVSFYFFFLAVNPTKVSGDSTDALANFDTKARDSDSLVSRNRSLVTRLLLWLQTESFANDNLGVSPHSLSNINQSCICIY